MNAINALRHELRLNQQAQSVLVTESGYVKPDFRYEYKTLVEKAKEIQSGIELLTRFRERGDNDNQRAIR